MGIGNAKLKPPDYGNTTKPLSPEVPVDTSVWLNSIDSSVQKFLDRY